MALIPCEECGAQISEQAWKCPQCGMPNTQPVPLPPRFYDENGDIKRLKLFFNHVLTVLSIVIIMCVGALFLYLIEEM
jgi:uncharacterized membrane protein YvbJ